MNFLSQIAENVIVPQKIDYKDVAIILPNKRAQRTLEIELAKTAQTPIISPVIFSIDEFISRLSNLEVLPTSELLIDLYGVYTTVAPLHGTEADDFQKYMSWGVQLIGDINDIDRQMADAHDVFSYLKDFKDIGIEIDSGGQPTEGQRRYLKFFELLYDLYTSFRKLLHDKGKAYPGMAYREAAEKISENIKNQHFEKFFFVGLNAMTPAEAQIFHCFYQQGNAEFIFDFDEFYLEYTSQIRDELHHRFKLEDKDLRSIGNHFADSPKTIRTYGVSKTMNQIYQAIDLLNEIEKQEPDALNRTAVVLADESLIVPFVHAYDIAKCNISMKYPVRATSTYRLLQILLKMARNVDRFNSANSERKALYYHKDVLGLYRHPDVAAAFFESSAQHQLFINSLVGTNQVLFSQKWLNERISQSCPDLTVRGGDLIESIRNFFQVLADKTVEEGETDSRGKMLRLFISALETAHLTLARFETSSPIEVRTVEFFINEQIDKLDFSFKGNLEKGVQVMGLLETRTLDFEHVIMLSVNEGTIPSGNNDNSLILYEIKKHFHLSTYEQNDAIYAYHFFHILQRASDIHLIYNADATDAVAEPSRFIRQIDFKIKKWNLSNISFQEVIKPPLPLGEKGSNEAITIQKTDEIRERLLKMRYSASSLNTFINCPLQFYLKYVADICPEDEINENIEQNVVGLVIHQALEEMGNAMIKAPSEAPEVIIDEWLAKIDGNYIEELFEKQEDIKGQDISTGRLYIATQVVKKTLITYLPTLKTYFSKGINRVLGCELEFTHTLDIAGNAIRFKGVADRIDLQGDSIAILDYKSGKSFSTAFKSIDELFTDTKKKHIFQLFFYQFLYKNRDREAFPQDHFPDGKELKSGIIYFQDMMKNAEFTNYATLALTTTEVKKMAEGGKQVPSFDILLEEYETKLKYLISNILKEDIFTQTDNTDHCTYCDYAAICHREKLEKKF